jgi:ribosomal-protein-alanine N-acetyltransferase
MPEPRSVIHAPRLDLVLMSAQLMWSMHAADWATAARLLGAQVPEEWRTANWRWLGTRPAQAEADPSVIPWLPRAQLLRQPVGRGRSEPVVVGEVSFHGPPDGEGQVELGYSVVTGQRRRGFAEEAVRALTAWAAREHGVTRFRACIGPQDIPSLNLIRKLGFIQAGACHREGFGELLIFHRDGLPV